MIEAKHATKDRILDAAEHLFAERGFAETSLRDITTEADANLAAVNYHFQSKDALIQALFARRIGPVNEQRRRNLDALEAAAGGQPLAVEDLIRALIQPWVQALSEAGGSNAAQLMGRMLIEPGDLFERFFREQLSAMANRFLAAFQKTLPEIPEAELYWRFFFMVGAVGHTMAGLRKVAAFSGGRCEVGRTEDLLKRLTAFISGGLCAPVDPSLKGDVPCDGSL
jgi:AcrR family transcriptional regulator